jgi:phage protein D
MPTATYREFREVLQQAGFRLIRSKKHETWERTLATGEILQIRLSHQMSRDIPTPLFHAMLRQAQMTQAEFFARLRQG